MRGFVLLAEAIIVAFIVLAALLLFFKPPIIHVSPLLTLISAGDSDSVRIDSGAVPLGECRFYTDPVTMTVVSRC